MLQVNDTTKTVERTADTKSNQFSARDFNKHCFAHRDTKQTEETIAVLATTRWSDWATTNTVANQSHEEREMRDAKVRRIIWWTWSGVAGEMNNKLLAGFVYVRVLLKIAE